jgi:hypothetical protein
MHQNLKSAPVADFPPCPVLKHILKNQAHGGFHFFDAFALGTNRVRVKNALRVHTNHASPALRFVVMPWHGTLKSSVMRPELLLNFVSNLGK